MTDNFDTQSIISYSFSPLGSQGTTDSSKSGAPSFKEEDLIAESAFSPIDLECDIQAERIRKILNELLYRTKMALALPTLVRNAILDEVLAPNDLGELLDIFECHQNLQYSTVSFASQVNAEEIQNSFKGTFTPNMRAYPEIAHLTYILNRYPALKPKVEEIVAEIKKEYLHHDPQDRDNTLEYLFAVEKFREIMMAKIATSAAKDLEVKLKTRKLENKNNQLISAINSIEQKIIKERLDFDTKMGNKTAIANELKVQLSKDDAEVAAKLQKIVLKSNGEMCMQSQLHKVRNQMLKEDEAETREAFKRFQNKCLIGEKNSRVKKCKVETQYLSWIRKYDTDMEDKQRELDEFKEKYNEERKKVQQLEAEIEEQNKQYIPLMAEKEEEYTQELTKKMNAFMQEHAAKVIQTAWKQILRNRLERKKLRDQLDRLMRARRSTRSSVEKRKKKGKK